MSIDISNFDKNRYFNDRLHFNLNPSMMSIMRHNVTKIKISRHHFSAKFGNENFEMIKWVPDDAFKTYRHMSKKFKSWMKNKVAWKIICVSLLFNHAKK